jgi:hypothetical protein
MRKHTDSTRCQVCLDPELVDQGRRIATRHSYPPGFDPSLKLGRGAIASLRKSPLGTSPSALCFIHIVPPVMMMSTLLSGYGEAMLPIEAVCLCICGFGMRERRHMRRCCKL